MVPPSSVSALSMHGGRPAGEEPAEDGHRVREIDSGALAAVGGCPTVGRSRKAKRPSWRARTGGIAVLRLPRRPTKADLLTGVETLARALARESPAGEPWVVEAGRVRVFQEE